MLQLKKVNSYLMSLWPLCLFPSSQGHSHSDIHQQIQHTKTLKYQTIYLFYIKMIHKMTNIWGQKCLFYLMWRSPWFLSPSSQSSHHSDKFRSTFVPKHYSRFHLTIGSSHFTLISSAKSRCFWPWLQLDFELVEILLEPG